MTIPKTILDQLSTSDASWGPTLLAGLEAVAQADPAYLETLQAEDYLPNKGRLFAAFAQSIDRVNYVLIGEGPYPRPDSATGVCFMDGAVGTLWSENGLSKQVNRATSLRNFMKLLLVADKQLSIERTSADAMSIVAQQATAAGSHMIQTLPELQHNLEKSGFLLLNATLVFRPNVPPLKEARAWLPFLQVVLAALIEHADKRDRMPPTLVLWGKVAELLSIVPANERFPKAISEHPYNLTFIGNAGMQKLFGPMTLLRK